MGASFTSDCASETSPQAPSSPALVRAAFHPVHTDTGKMQAAAFRTSLPRAGVFSGSRVAVAPQRAAVCFTRRSAVQVMAAGEDQKKKRTPQPEKRASLALERRSRNRSRKSAIATRTKKVCAIRASAGAANVTCGLMGFLRLFNCCKAAEWVCPWGTIFSSNHKTPAAALLLGAWAAAHCPFAPQRCIHAICGFCLANLGINRGPTAAAVRRVPHTPHTAAALSLAHSASVWPLVGQPAG